jgi:hypothetical protein
MKLNELFRDRESRPPATHNRNPEPQVTWDVGPDMIAARTRDRQGRELDVKFVWSNENTVDIDFERAGSVSTTGEGDEIWIFTTVINIVREFMNRYGARVDTVYFTGATDRKALYSRIIQRVAQELGFERVNRDTSGVFKLKRRQDR